MDSPVISVKPGAQERLAVFLAFMAGYVDGVGYMKLKTYVSFMSGNTTQVGFNIAHGSIAAASSAVTAIGGFVAGIYLGTCLSVWRPHYSNALNIRISSGLLLLYMTLSHFFFLSSILAVWIISLSMGVMNTIVSSVGKQAVNTDFVSGTLNSLAKKLASFSMAKNAIERTEHKVGALRLLFLWLGFLSGAAVGVLAVHLFGGWSLGVPALFLLSGPFLWKNYFRR